MAIESMTIRISRLRVYAYHGVLPQEGRVGNTYLLDIRLDLSDTAAALTDDLAATVDYGAVCSLVRREMATPSRLLESLAYRVAMSILQHFPKVARITLSLDKDNPPVGGDIGAAGVEVVVGRH